LLNNQFAATSKGASALKIVFDLKAPLSGRSLAGIGSAGGFGGKREDTETFYSFTSFTIPATIYPLRHGKR